MFMKQYNYKPRSGSQSSGTAGQGVAGSPPKGGEEQKQDAGAGGASITQQAMGGTSGGAGAGAGAGATAGAAGRRRSSASGADKFAGLQGHKRNSQDQTMADRKASWADQKPAGGGILGGMWQNFTKGS